MTSPTLRFIQFFLFLSFFPATLFGQDKPTEAEILKHGDAIRTAFRKGDVAAIKSFHHPDVVKALSYTKVVVGREAMLEDLKGTLDAFTLEFVENNVESIFIEGDVAIEQTLFSIRGTPKSGGQSFTFNGRTMVTYIRYKESPTGWATIREIIQPSTN